MTHTFTRAIYAVFGSLALVAGTAALFMPSLALPPDRVSGLTTHLIREQAAGFIFIGLMFFWCLRHFEQRRPIHVAFLVFTGLFAAIHWAGFVQDGGSVWGAVANTVPFAILAMTVR